MYDIRDLLQKAITQTENRKLTYLKLLENSPDPRMRILVQVMIARLDQDIAFYNKLLSDLDVNTIEPIDFGVYDTIASLINQFARRMMVPTCKTRKEFVQFVTEVEQSVYALMVDIQGRLAQAEGRTDGITYMILSKVILHKSLRIQELENYKE